jgi:hypothetical protein
MSVPTCYTQSARFKWEAKMAVTVNSEFQSMFGSSPNGDSAVECQKWQRLCETMLAERERLREQLTAANTKLTEYRLMLNSMMCEKYQFVAKEELLARCGDGEPTMEELIIELEQQLGKTA